MAKSLALIARRSCSVAPMSSLCITGDGGILFIINWSLIQNKVLNQYIFDLDRKNIDQTPATSMESRSMFATDPGQSERGHCVHAPVIFYLIKCILYGTGLIESVMIPVARAIVFVLFLSLIFLPA